MIKVLQCISNMCVGGAETMLMNYYKCIDRDQMQFDFLVNKSDLGAYAEKILCMGGKIHVAPKLNPFDQREYGRFILELFEKHPEYRIIHCHNEQTGYFALKYAKKAGIPVRITHSHSSGLAKDYKYLIKRWCMTQLPNVANLQMACSKKAAQFMFGTQDVMLLRNAIDVQRFAYNDSVRQEARKHLGIGGEFIVGSVGNFLYSKNQEFLIEVFYWFHKMYPNARLILLGDGPLRDKLMKLVRDKGLLELVSMPGTVFNTPAYYNAMDVFLLPSRFEGFPVVSVEAQTAGLPCFLSDRITNEVDLTGNVHFLSIDQGPKLWVDAIACKGFHKRVDKSAEVAAAGFSIEVEAAKLQKFYERLHGGG